MEAMKGILENWADASAVTRIWSEKSWKKERWRVVVDVVGHLEDTETEETVSVTRHLGWNNVPLRSVPSPSCCLWKCCPRRRPSLCICPPGFSTGFSVCGPPAPGRRSSPRWSKWRWETFCSGCPPTAEEKYGTVDVFCIYCRLMTINWTAPLQ